MAPNSTSSALSMKAKTWRLIESSERVIAQCTLAAGGRLLAFGPCRGALLSAARRAHGDRGTVREEAGAVGGDGLAGAQTLDHLLQAILAHAGLHHALARHAVLD